MTDHYTEAQRDIDRADNAGIDGGFAQYLISRAQVHATLALVDTTRAMPAAFDPTEECACGHRRIDHDSLRGVCNISGGDAYDDVSCYCYEFEAAS